MKKIIKEYTHGWLSFGRLGIRYGKDFIENFIGFLIWIPCFAFYPIFNRIINSRYFK